jgi:hypothetical protein
MAAMALIHDKVFQMRATAEFYERIDEWRRQQQGIPSRAEAIRRLLEIGLKHGGATKPAPARKRGAK